ncbi:MAG: glycosyltransferase [Cytophaga sp.]|uniref:glycosyltransferase n=1 Tax=Cytophaga sp. TaxID=29535 RepID=UPI003F7E8BE5
MNKKHVLYITYDGLTDFLGQSQVLPYILGLEEQGYRFSILSFEKPEKFSSNKAIIEGLIQQRNIRWYPKKYHKRFSILATLWDTLIGVMFLIRLQSRDKFQGVHCRSYIPAIMGLISKKIFKTKFIFDMRGFWADERIDGGLWNLQHPVYKMVYSFFKWIEKKCLLNADYVVTLTAESYREMQQWKYMTGTVPFKIIPCCVDTELFSLKNVLPDILLDKRKALQLEGRTVVNYLGSIGTWYMIDEMFEFFKCFKEQYANAVFLFVTPEPEQDVLKIAARHGVQVGDIRIVKAQRMEVPYYLALSDYALFFIKPTYSKKSSSPTKLAEIMAMGVPVVCNTNVGDVEAQVNTAKAGVVIKSFERQSYANALQEINNKDAFQKETALSYVNQHFSLATGVSLYSEIYSEIIL